MDDLLKELCNTQNQMAILLMNMAGCLVYTTLEDPWKKLSVKLTRLDKLKLTFEIGDNTYVVQGAMSLNDFNEYFYVELKVMMWIPLQGIILTEVGRIHPLKERLSCEVDSQKKHLISNDKW